MRPVRFEVGAMPESMTATRTPAPVGEVEDRPSTLRTALVAGVLDVLDEEVLVVLLVELFAPFAAILPLVETFLTHGRLASSGRSAFRTVAETALTTECSAVTTPPRARI